MANHTVGCAPCRDGTDKAWVAGQINRGNPWYVGSQFEWANRPSIRPIYRRRHEFFCRCIERAQSHFGTPLRVLDAGCGDGYWLHRLANLSGVQFVGIDSNPVRVERAAEVAPHADVRCCDVMEFTTDEPFHLILHSQVIEHVRDDVGMLRKLASLLYANGTVILGTPNEGSRLHRWAERWRGDQFVTDHVHFYTEPVIRRRIEEAGFFVDRVMREAFCVGHDRLFYALARRRSGFWLLETLTRLIPSECSDFYFECRLLPSS